MQRHEPNIADHMERARFVVEETRRMIKSYAQAGIDPGVAITGMLAATVSIMIANFGPEESSAWLRRLADDVDLDNGREPERIN